MSRFVRPESEKLEISGGDWLLVKRRLTAGEERHAFARIVKRMVIGAPTEINPEATGLNKIVAYLLDWSLRDDDGAVVIIRDQPANVVEAALLALEPGSFREIHDAVVAHETREAALLADEKKTRDGEIKSSVISGSAASWAGRTTSSSPSPPPSIASSSRRSTRTPPPAPDPDPIPPTSN